MTFIAATLLYPLWAIKLLGSLRTRVWVDGWLELLERGSTLGAGAVADGSVVCLEGRSAPTTSEALTSPVDGSPCAGWWAEVTGGPQVPLSIPLVVHGRASAFRVEGDWGAAEVEPEGTNISGLGLRPLDACFPLAELPRELASKLDQPELELRLWDRLWVSQWSLGFGRPCTVIGRLSKQAVGVPYRRSELPVVGGGGTLLVAAMTRDELAARLRASQRKATTWAIASTIGGALGLVIPAWSALAGSWHLPIAVAAFTFAAVLCNAMLDRYRALGLPPHTWPVAPPR